jgi:hypothetical protein
VIPFEKGSGAYKEEEEIKIPNPETPLMFLPLPFLGWTCWGLVRGMIQALASWGFLSTSTVYFDRDQHGGPIPSAFWTEADFLARMPLNLFFFFFQVSLLKYR